MPRPAPLPLATRKRLLRYGEWVVVTGASSRIGRAGSPLG
jgi:NADPH:quinone reductase-like Zn-dependent oxidoreductase